MKIYSMLINSSRLVCLAAGCSVLFVLTACDKRPAFPENVAKVVEAVKDDSPEKFASTLDYPVVRPYPLKDIPDSAEMVKYYKTLVDDSLKRVVSRSRPSDWQEVGWRGRTLKDGEYLWVDEKVYEIPYVSADERKMMDTLTQEELATLPSEMREGWHPAGCLVNLDDGTVYRIDANKKPGAPQDSLFRLSVYHPKSDLRNIPDASLIGYMKVEGSAGVRTYYFRDNKGESMEYSPDDNGDGDNKELSVVWKGPGAKSRSYKAKKSYWRELIKGDRQSPDSLTQPRKKIRNDSSRNTPSRNNPK